MKRRLSILCIGVLSSVWLGGCGGGSGSVQPPAAFIHVSGTVAGLHGLPITLYNNGGDPVTVNADGAFSFPAAVQGSYAVTIGVAPRWTECHATNGSGTSSVDVSNVVVNCGGAQSVGTLLIADTRAYNVAVDSADNVYYTGSSTVGFSYVAVLPHSSGAVIAGWSDSLNARFHPAGIAVDASMSMIITETSSSSVLKKTQAGVITTLASGLTNPGAITIDQAGNLYFVVDAANGNANSIVKLTPGGTSSVVVSGVTAAAIAVDVKGNLYTADPTHNAIMKITADGTATPIGNGFNAPTGVAVDPQGTVYVADSGNAAIKKIDPDGNVTRIATQESTDPNRSLVLGQIAVDVEGDLIATNDLDIGEVVRFTPTLLSASGQ